MPWTASNTINSLKKKPLEQRELFAEVANKVLSRGGSEEQAIQAGLSAVSKSQGKVRVKKESSAQADKKDQPSIPPHLAAILALKSKRQAEQAEQAIAPESPTNDSEPFCEQANTQVLSKADNRLEADSERSLVAVEWDKQDRLVLRFDDGEELVSPPIPVTNTVRNSTIVVGSSSEGGGGTTVVNANIVPTNASQDFVVLANTQALFAEEINMPEDTWIDINEGAILTEVN